LRFEVLTAVSLKVTDLWDVTPLNLIDSEKAAASIFKLEDEGRRFLRNVGNDISDYTVSHYTRM
jgi:hypothetical protein